MAEISISCFACSKKAEQVMVMEDRLMLYCSEHVLERLKLHSVHTIFPVIAWKFAQSLSEFNPKLISDFLVIDSTVRRIEAVQSQEIQLRSMKLEGPTQSRSSQPQIDQEALAYVSAILKSVREEANNPPSQWQNAHMILACQVLYTRYLPVLLPIGEIDYRTYVSVCDLKCKQVVKLMEVLKETKALGQMESANWYFHRRTIGKMCEAIETLCNSIAEGSMEFVQVEGKEKVTLQELIGIEIVETCKTMRNQSLSQGKYTRAADFERAAVHVWGRIADLSLDMPNLIVATFAFIRKGEAYQALKEYKEAEECYQSSREIGSAETNDLKRYTLLDVRLGQLLSLIHI